MKPETHKKFHFAFLGVRVVNYTLYEPVLTEYGAFKNNLLKQLNKFIGKVRSHEGFHSDRDVFWILGFRQSSLHHLQTNNRVKSSKLGHQVNSDTHLQTV